MTAASIFSTCASIGSLVILLLPGLTIRLELTCAVQRSLGSAVDAQEASLGVGLRAKGLRTRRQWEGDVLIIGLGRGLGQLLVGSRASLGLRCCASDRGEGG